MKKNTIETYRGSLADEKGLQGSSVLSPTREIDSSAPMLSRPPDRLRDIDISLIIPDPTQARKIFEGIDELAGSIKEKGIITPLIVSRCHGEGGAAPDRYQLIAGERRWRAAQLAGLKRVPCVIKNVGNPDEIGLIENVHRRDLTHIEKSLSIRDIIERYGYKQSEFAEKMVLQKSTVSEAIKTAAFADEYLTKKGSLDDLLSARTRDGKPLGARHYREITAQPTFDEQVALLNRIVIESLTSRETAHVATRKIPSASWDASRVLRRLKSMKKTLDVQVLAKIDTITATPDILAELEKTYTHFSQYTATLKAKIDSMKG